MNADFLRDRCVTVCASADGTTASISRWQVGNHWEFRHVHSVRFRIKTAAAVPLLSESWTASDISAAIHQLDIEDPDVQQCKSKVKPADFYSALYTTLISSGAARVNEGSHSFTYRSHI